MALRINPGDTRGAIVEPEPYPYEPTLAVNAATLFARIVLSGDLTLLPPTGAEVDGARLELWLFADGADRNLSFDDAIGMGQNGESQPIVIDANTTAVVKMRYDGPRNLWSLDGLMDQF